MQHRAFTLLIAILVSSVMLSIGYSLVNLSVKQILLSAAGRESQFAFYAADAGIECALFYENGAHNLDGRSIFDHQSTTNTVACGAEVPINIIRQVVDSTPADQNAGTFTTTVSLQAPIRTRPGIAGPCVDFLGVRVYNKATQVSNTTVESSGYNTCNTNSTTRLQRTIKVTY